MDKVENTKTTVLVDRALLRRAKIAAATNGQTIRGLVEKSLSDYLDTLDAGKKKTTTNTTTK